jgi:hypothetical protein
MMREQTELRAERLRVAVHVIDAAPDYEAGLYREARPLVSRHDTWLFQTCSADDQLLALACLDAERDMRRREWAALETLLAAIPPGGDLWDIYNLPEPQMLPALRAASECGWLREEGA